MKYRGERYTCPVCDARLRAFIPLSELEHGKHLGDLEVDGVLHPVTEYETLNLENFLCPLCESSDRARLFALYLGRELAKLRPEALVIHFAPDSGLAAFISRYDNVRYRSADLSRPGVDLQTDLANMPKVRDESVDLFICSHVLEHVPDDRKALSELRRVLKPSGWGILMVPILLTIDETYEDTTKVTEAERLLHFGLEDHLRVYSKRDFLRRVTEAGFTTECLGSEHFGEAAFDTSGITKKSVLVVVRKPPSV